MVSSRAIVAVDRRYLRLELLGLARVVHKQAPQRVRGERRAHRAQDFAPAVFERRHHFEADAHSAQSAKVTDGVDHGQAIAQPEVLAYKV